MSATIRALRLKTDTHSGEYALRTAVVTGRSGDHYLLDHTEATGARLAASCLLTPETGDTVLVTQACNGAETFVLAILSRQAPDSGRVQLPGGNSLYANTDGVEIAGNAVKLAARSTLDLNSPELNVSALAAHMNVKHANSCFDTLDTQAVNVSLTAKTFSAQIGRMIQRMVESFRKVSGLDETRAGRVRVSAEDHHQIDAGHLTHRANGFVKIDGNKIDLG
jgi:Protein of unknown function (DUF3540).